MWEPIRGALPSKLYYRIGEVAELVGVEPHVLRYWEREFRNIRPTKSAKGQRVYSRRDVENLLRVRQLLYGEGFTIAGAKRQLRNADPTPSPTAVVPLLASGHTPDRREDAPAARSEREPERPRLRPELQPETRQELLAMRADIEAFLSELGLPRRDTP